MHGRRSTAYRNPMCHAKGIKSPHDLVVARCCDHALLLLAACNLPTASRCYADRKRWRTGVDQCSRRS